MYPWLVVNPAACAHADRIEQLARRLDELDEPVGASGILRVHDLLTDGCGPLHNPALAEQLPAALDDALSALSSTRTAAEAS